MKLSVLHTLLFTVALAGCAASNHAAPASETPEPAAKSAVSPTPSGGFLKQTQSSSTLVQPGARSRSVLGRHCCKDLAMVN
ncbi:hypothetical protein BBW68_13705 [Candidatus Erwinia dacicola]|uniref:Putative lipoprotein n=1 Tax=Candidatus Erwinia dacicola TaxID=252393 RepID=A0A1E7YWY8_9GAMM|nr:hypothetical protein BBW68_13705 [Candidatus Erwinia dacicola]RAP71103.1 putative lipoprotein [Candidatus Erwinia dacicola]